MTLNAPSSGFSELLALRVPEAHRALGGETRALSSAVARLKDVLERDVVALTHFNGIKSPPFDPFRIRRFGACSISFTFVEMAAGAPEGRLSVVPEGFRVELSSDLRADRHHTHVRAVAAHEVMHAFFFDTSRLPPRRLGPVSQEPKVFVVEEDICRHLARCFLVPQMSLKQQLARLSQGYSPTLAGLWYLCKVFDCSMEVMAYRLIRDTGSWDAAFYRAEVAGDSARLVFRVKAFGPHFSGVKLPYHATRSILDAYPALGPLWKPRDGPELEALEVANGRYLLQYRRDPGTPTMVSVLISRASGAGLEQAAPALTDPVHYLAADRHLDSTH